MTPLGGSCFAEESTIACPSARFRLVTPSNSRPRMGRRHVIETHRNRGQARIGGRHQTGESKSPPGLKSPQCQTVSYQQRDQRRVDVRSPQGLSISIPCSVALWTSALAFLKLMCRQNQMLARRRPLICKHRPRPVMVAAFRFPRRGSGSPRENRPFLCVSRRVTNPL